MRLLWPLKVETVVSYVSYLRQPGTAKNQMFSHDFEGLHLKKAKRRSEERYRFMLSGFLFILMVLHKLYINCHKT